MKKFISVFIFIFVSCGLFPQETVLLDYDTCKEDVSKHLLKKYEKAVNYYQNRKFNQASLLLQEIIKENEDFASPYFLMGMIGVIKNNTAMIMKYFPLVKEHCPDFSHPYLYYYSGMIDYTEEHYEQASKNFELFLNATDGNNFYDSLQNVAINYIDWSDFLNKTMENPVAFNPHKINFLTKNKNYYEPFITWDKKEIYFIREEVTRDTNTDSFLNTVNTHTERFTQKSCLDDNGIYDKGFICGAPFNTSNRESGVSVTADNNYLFFSRKTTTNGKTTWDIYYCEYFNGYWSEAKPLNINTENYDEFSPCVSADGSRLFFVSDREGGKGGYDIWQSEKTGKNSWSEPSNLGRNVNTFADETYPFVSADNNHLYFLSNGRKTIGGNDIFHYNIQNNTPADNIGYPINTEANERNTGIMIDGKTAYSVFKNKDNNFYEINTFELPENVRAQQRILVHAIAKKELDGDIILNIVEMQSNKHSLYYIADEHPEFNLVLNPQEENIIYINQKGYMFFIKHIENYNDSIIIEQKPLESGSSMNISGIGFEQDNPVFNGISIFILDCFAEFLKANPKIRITIQADNKFIKPLQEYLTKSGIRPDRTEFHITASDVITYTIK